MLNILLEVYPTDSILYLITSHDVTSLHNDRLTFNKICTNIEGNNEFTGIGYELEVGLYTVTRHAQTSECNIYRANR